MRKLLLANLDLGMDGVVKTSIELLKKAEKENFDSTFVCIRARGFFLPNIPSKTKIEEINVSDEQADIMVGRLGTKLSAKYYLSKKHPLVAAKIVIKRILNRPYPYFVGKFNHINSCKGFFDIALCYNIDTPFIVRYVAEKITAKKKYCWIHNSFRETHCKVKTYKKYLDMYDKFFAVSQVLMDEFVIIFPEYKDKTEVFHNIVDVDDIVAKSNVPVDWDSDYTGSKILSVGRLSEQKGFDMAIEVAKLLKAEGIDFRWYIVGDGADKESLQKKIVKYGLESCFILLGAIINPYPYFKECTIYVQPSRHEGYCTTTNEAKILCKPIITTNVAGANEQFLNGVNGVVCDKTIGDIYLKTKDLLLDKSKQMRFSEALKVATFEDDFSKLLLK